MWNRPKQKITSGEKKNKQTNKKKPRDALVTKISSSCNCEHLPVMPTRCPYCAKTLPTGKSVRQHVAASQSCTELWEAHQLAKIPTKSKKPQQNGSLPSPPPLPSPPRFDMDIDHISDEEMDILSHEFVLPQDGPEPAIPRIPSPELNPPVDNPTEDHDDQPTSQSRYSEAYPHSAAQPIRQEKTEFENFRDNDSTAGRQPWEPFSSKKEWELATWIIRNVNQRATEQYLNLPIVSV